MTSLHNTRFGLGIVLSVASVALTFNTQALAQDPMDPTLAPPEDGASSASVGVGVAASGDTAAPPSVEADTAASAEAPAADEPAEQPSAETVEQAEKGAPLSPELPPASTTATGTSVEREGAVTLLGLESLPGSAYPEAYIRGLKYASLWRTFHGQQWPYMPQIGDKPALRVGFSGYIWNDLSHAQISADPSLAGAGITDAKKWTTQTRGIIRVTPTYNAGDGWFAQGNAEAVVQGSMNADPITQVLATTDDVWVRVGKWDLFDVTVGRFQGWEIANHFGMGLDWATLERQGAWITGQGSLDRPTDGYALNYFWDRQNLFMGTYAVHVYPTKYLRAEVMGHIGQGSGVTNPYSMDIRPSAIFDIGFLKLKAGWEFGSVQPANSKLKENISRNGYGVAAQVVFAPYVEFGGSFARGFTDVMDYLGNPDLAASTTSQTVGGFLNASPGHEPLVIGLGAFWNSTEDLRFNIATQDVDLNAQQILFGAVQYTLWDQLYLKFVVSHASNDVEHFNKGIYTNSSTSGRLRVEFLY
jgi:hypothetical protein